MLNITDPRITSYLLAMSPERGAVLREMEAFAKSEKFPIVGPLVGAFLRQLALIMKAQRIFEMGSGFGYSAFWFAGALGRRAKIVCTDASEENKEKALYYLRKGGYESLVEFRVGDACEVIQSYDGHFDIILNDIDKTDYPKAFDLAIPRLRKGGVFVTDNVLWSGRILEKNPDRSAEAIIEFNRRLFGSSGILPSIIPIRDGLGLAVKL